MNVMNKGAKTMQNKQKTGGWFQPCGVNLGGSGELLCLWAPTNRHVFSHRSLQPTHMTGSQGSYGGQFFGEQVG